MSKKDYVLLANALRCVRPEGPRSSVATDIAGGQWERDVRSIAAALAHDNERFDRERFMAACKGENSPCLSEGKTVDSENDKA